MFGEKNKEIYTGRETQPISIGGVNDSPFMQEMLRGEERRRVKHDDETHYRREGYIK
ncbi:MAG: hypothetical protein K6G10_03050 [Butyrivibrio sp.]|nr:hypothetical protein [Butyrivibrio sp.]